MNSNNGARLRRAAFAILLPTAVVALACTDRMPMSPDNGGEIAELVNARVQTHIRLLNNSRFVEGAEYSASSNATLPIFRHVAANASLARSTGALVIYREMRDQNGDLLTLGIVPGAEGRPLKRLYLFKNGVIRYIYSPKFVRSGKGWLRERAKAIAFDAKGSAFAEYTVGPERIGAARAGQSRFSVVAYAKEAAAFVARLVVPKAAYAQTADTATDGCIKEFLTYFGGEMASVGGGTLAGLAISGCVLTPAVPICAGAAAAIGASATTWANMVNWTDQLIGCNKDAIVKSMNTNTSAPGGETTNKVPSTTAPADNTRVTPRPTVSEFIAEAERNGTYSCSEGGDVCQYFDE